MKKVSLISPCYNGEKYVCRFLDSLLEQTYDNVEFIFVNDGSTDNTEEIFMSYKPKLENKGWKVIYIRQENAGQAAALNNGLKIFSGDYLIFPDSDDILYPNHISKKVEFMEQHPECGLAFCILDVVNENDISKVIHQQRRKPSKNDNLFEDLIFERNIIWTPVGNIFRSKCFLEAVPSRHIYEGKGGQNFQMLLPMAHKFKCGYIEEALAKYVVRKASHSRIKEIINERPYLTLNIKINTILTLEADNDQKANWIEQSSILFHEKLPPSSKNIYKVFLFKFLPLLKIKEAQNKIKFYLFGFIHFLTVRREM